MTRNRWSGGLLGLGVLATAACLLFLPTPAVEAQGAAPSIWKDVQVLPKTITKPELKALMKTMSKDLGVDCEFCHKENDFAQDTNHKKTAREMMRMVEEMNKKYPTTMKGVTCYSCHRGKQEPDKRPK